MKLKWHLRPPVRHYATHIPVTNQSKEHTVNFILVSVRQKLPQEGIKTCTNYPWGGKKREQATC